MEKKRKIENNIKIKKTYLKTKNSLKTYNIK